MFTSLSSTFSSIFSRITGQRYLSEKNIEQTIAQVQQALIEADVPYAVVQKFIEEIKHEVIGQKVRSSLNAGEQLIKIVHDKLVVFLGSKTDSSLSAFSNPGIVIVMGLQGSGKTTTIGKIAHNLLEQAKANGKSVKIAFASVDFYRPAAREQLEILAQKVGAAWFNCASTDPLRAAQDALAYYKHNKVDLLFLDTAGRLHVDRAMLDELKAITNAVNPHYKLLVLDAMTGQESLRVAQAFDQEIGFNAGILTKLDSDTRAGAAFAFRYQIQKPLIFVGTGEKMEDLEPFRPERIASRMLGMGDVQSLLERAKQKIKQEDQKEAEQAFLKGELTLQDFSKQMDMLSRLGSISSVLQYIPGMNAAKLSPDMIAQGEKQIKRFKAIVSSMTLKERLNTGLLNSSRKQRIAKGAGVAVSEINLLLERFEQTKHFVKLFKKSGRFPGF